jgi:hypothetical protein
VIADEPELLARFSRAFETVPVPVVVISLRVVEERLVLNVSKEVLRHEERLHLERSVGTFDLQLPPWDFAPDEVGRAVRSQSYSRPRITELIKEIADGRTTLMRS